DRNGDGKVTRDELPAARAQIILLHYDRDHDEAIDAAEAARFYEMVRLRPGQRTTKEAKGRDRDGR
ncbi:MAG: hypothetical protein KAI24_15725, partial [Planctomycetes bacterium]|nr:hypothetical protein [Planctomycetota bacterium]